MATWSAENATNAYLRAMKMVQGKREKEPDTAEFISALVAGTNARLMVMACGGAADSTALALVAAAHQTGGEVVCIVSGPNELFLSKEFLGESVDKIKFVIGKAENLLGNEYREADCVVFDCGMENCEEILETVKGFERKAMVLGYNAFRMRCKVAFDDAHLLPIGEGLLVSRVAVKGRLGFGSGKKSRWIVKVDKCTGEEHFFRVGSCHGKAFGA